MCVYIDLCTVPGTILEAVWASTLWDLWDLCLLDGTGVTGVIGSEAPWVEGLGSIRGSWGSPTFPTEGLLISSRSMRKVSLVLYHLSSSIIIYHHYHPVSSTMGYRGSSDFGAPNFCASWKRPCNESPNTQHQHLSHLTSMPSFKRSKEMVHWLHFSQALMLALKLIWTADSCSLWDLGFWDRV